VIRVTWEKDTLVKDILNDLEFLKVLFDIRQTTIPFISKYSVTIDSFYPNSTKVDLTITNSEGNVTYYDKQPVRTDQFENFMSIVFEIENFVDPNKHVVTLGDNTFKCQFYNVNDVVIGTTEQIFDCKYIMSVLTWICWFPEEVYKELLGYIDWLSLQTISPEDLYKKVGFLLDQPFYISSEQYQKIIKGLFEGNIYGGTVKGIKSVLDGVVNAFGGSYDLVYAKETVFWRLPKKHTSGKFYTKYSDLDLDEPGENWYEPVNGIFKDTKSDRIHYRFKKINLNYSLESNEQTIVLLSHLTKLIGYIVKFYDLKQAFPGIIFTVQGDGPHMYNTNLPCIIKSGDSDLKAELWRQIGSDTWTKVDSGWNIVGRNVVRISENFSNKTTFKLTGYTLPFDIVKECVNNSKSILTRIYTLYYQDKNKPLFETYTEE